MNHILMPVRNCLDLTRRAVETALAQDVPVLLNIINNGSDALTRDYLLELELGDPERVTVEHNYPGRCVAASWNQGLIRLFWHNAPWVLVINNDVELQPHTFRSLIEQNLQLVSGVGVDSRAQVVVGPPGPARPHPDFSCFLIRRDLFLQVGLFDETFRPAYMEDNDYHRRIQAMGLEAWCVDVPFLHDRGSHTIQQDPTAAAENDKRRQIGNVYYVGKWGGAPGKETLLVPFER